MLVTVHYQIGTYEGEIQVNASSDEEESTIIARAKRVLYQRSGGPPAGLRSERWRVGK